MSDRVPQPVAYTDGEMALAEALKMTTAQLRTVRRCPDCDDLIIPCDNGVWLDAERSDDSLAAMGIMEVAGMMLAAGGAAGGSRHALHQHQPSQEASTDE